MKDHPPLESNRFVAFRQAFSFALKSGGHNFSGTRLEAAQSFEGATDLEALLRACQSQNIPARLCADDDLDALLSRHELLILVLSSSDPCVAVFRRSEQQGASLSLRVFHESGENETVQWSPDTLKQACDGQAVSIEPYLSKAPEAHAKVSRIPRFRQWLWGELKRLSPVYRDVVLASFLINLFVIASPLFLMNVYDRVVPNAAIETLWVLASGVLVVFLFDLVIRSLRHFFIEQAGRRLDLVLSSRLFEHALNLKADFFPRSVGSFANYFRDLDSIRQFFTASSLTLLVDLPFALLFLLIIYWLGGVIVVPVLVAGLLMIGLGVALHFPLKRAIESSQALSAQKQSVLIETLSQLETLKGFNAEVGALNRWEQAIEGVIDRGEDARRIADRLLLVSQFIMQVTLVVVVIVGVYRIAGSAMSIGALIACVLLVGRALSPLAQVANLCTQFYRAKSALDAVTELSEMEGEQGSTKSYLQAPEPEGRIEFSNAVFQYEPGRRVLDRVSLRLEPGEKVAIIGRVGSGKSSLLKLLLRLGDLSEGHIKLDGIDVRHINPADIREVMGYVPQDVTLLSGTLRDNVALKNRFASDKDIMEVLTLAGLDEFVNTHPMGLDAPILEQGKGLSGGQRQGVAIARALLGNPRILLLDELTSAMDNQTEARIIAGLSSLNYPHTLVVSTHRTSLLKLVDRIIVLEQGRVVADGPKTQVLEALRQGLIHTGQQGES